MNNYDSMEYRKYTYKSEFDKAIHTLEGILKGIAFDNKIHTSEFEELKNWYILHKNLIRINPFNEIISIVELSIEDNELTYEEVEDILWVCKNFTTENNFYDMITSDIQRLQGLLHGILSDNIINDEEIIELRDWLNENCHLEKTYPYDEIYSLITSVLSDGKIDDYERDILKVYFSEFIDTKTSYNINSVEIDKLKEEIKISGICSVCPEIDIENSTFCFTGVSSRGTRSKIKTTVESLNGIFKENLTQDTNYLVIGDFGNPCWAFSCYGRKVEKAMKLRKEGKPLLIIHENDFWDTVNDLI